MGGMVSWFNAYFQSEKFVAVLGLDGAGKTALVHRLLYGETTDPLPTMGFYIHNALVNNTVMQLADVCGQDSIRVIWRSLYHSADGIIFVIDGMDRARLRTALVSLKEVMVYPALEDKPFLILVNKHDEDAVDVSEIKSEIKEGNWRAFNVSVKSGDGVDEAMQWFESNFT